MTGLFDGGVERAKKIQRMRLASVMQHCTGWGVLVFFENEPGDVSFLAPICSKLRGYEIVSADTEGLYDIWRRNKTGKLSMTKYINMDLEQIGSWLKERNPSEADYLKHATQWAEDTMKFYGVPQK